MIQQFKPINERARDIVREFLLGGRGIPNMEGNAVGGYVRETELKYRLYQGTCWFEMMKEFFMPHEIEIREDKKEKQVRIIVPKKELFCCMGWFGKLRNTKNVFFTMDKKGVERSVLHSEMMDHLHCRIYMDLDNILIGYENDEILIIMNGATELDERDTIFPLMYRIAEREKILYRSHNENQDSVNDFFTIFKGNVRPFKIKEKERSELIEL